MTDPVEGPDPSIIHQGSISDTLGVQRQKITREHLSRIEGRTDQAMRPEVPETWLGRIRMRARARLRYWWRMLNEPIRIHIGECGFE